MIEIDRGGIGRRISKIFLAILVVTLIGPGAYLLFYGCPPTCSGADLAQADMRGVQWGPVNLVEANLNRAELSEANLSRANMVGAKLAEANLSQTEVGFG